MRRRDALKAVLGAAVAPIVAPSLVAGSADAKPATAATAADLNRASANRMLVGEHGPEPISCDPFAVGMVTPNQLRDLEYGPSFEIDVDRYNSLSEGDRRQLAWWLRSEGLSEDDVLRVVFWPRFAQISFWSRDDRTVFCQRGVHSPPPAFVAAGLPRR